MCDYHSGSLKALARNRESEGENKVNDKPGKAFERISLVHKVSSIYLSYLNFGEKLGNECAARKDGQGVVMLGRLNWSLEVSNVVGFSTAR
jgi:hypothetical protein